MRVALRFCVLLTAISLAGCVSNTREHGGRDMIISDIRAGVIDAEKISQIPDGGEVQYFENHACAQENVSVPCMQLGVSFRFDWVGPQSQLICSTSISGDPVGMPEFSDYKDNTIGKEFIGPSADFLKSYKGPFIIRATVAPDLGGSGVLGIRLACRNHEKPLFAREIKVNIPTRKDGIPVPTSN